MRAAAPRGEAASESDPEARCHGPHPSPLPGGEGARIARSPLLAEGARITPSAPLQPRPTGAYVPTEEWTWRLLERGFTLDESAAIRGLERSAIIRHATWVARQGRPIPLDAFLSQDLIARWDAWHRQQGETPPPEPEAAIGLWPLYLACRKSGPGQP